ncbi:MAG: polyprenol monophosphomannose synthase [Muribaculum sp.]|nr:polyprenol monophosphomannose synthase [Muribaculum sp.]
MTAPTNITDRLVIIPTYNECENASAKIDAVMQLPVTMNVLIVDDGSPDGTADIVRGKIKEYPERVFLLERSGKQGLGTAYLAGFKWALERGYEYVFEMDADFSHNPADLVALYKACAEGGADVAVGSRYLTGVNVVNWPMSRVLMSYFASKYVRLILGIPVHDTTAGFVCYKARVLRHLDLDAVRFKGYAFQIEMKYSAFKSGFTIAEVPIVFVNRVLGESKMNTGIFSEAMFGVLRLRMDGLCHKFKKIQ